MDRLFKKRTNTVRDPRRAPSRQNSADDAAPIPSASSSKLSIRTTSTKRSQKGRARLDSATESPITPGSGGKGSSAGVGGPSGVGNALQPPSLDMDFRHSLLLPGLSQRFSVLLPSLSSIPERSLRPLLASQRQRNDLGPAITEEEEEMIFAELQDLAQQQKQKLEQWAEAPADNPVWSTMNLARWEHGANIPSAPRFNSSPEVPKQVLSGLSGSSSSPNLLAESRPMSNTSSASGKAPGSNGGTPIAEAQLQMSPPPTSTSFDSLSTFGSNGSGKTERDERAMARSRGYGGFGGGARMQEDAYLRRTRKESERERNASLSASGSSRSISGMSHQTDRTDGTLRADMADRDGQDGTGTPSRKAKVLSPISPDFANADWKRKPTSPTSPTESDRTATPTSALPSGVPGSGQSQRHQRFTRHSPSSSLSLNLPPQPPVPLSPPPEPPTADPIRQSQSAMAMGRPPKQRKSMLSILSDAQLKRISLALFEIGKELEAMGIKTTDDTDEEKDADDGEEKVNGQDAKASAVPEQSDDHRNTGARGIAEQTGGEEVLDLAGENRSARERVDSKSESGHSTGSSSVFPYHVSPTTSSFATVPFDPSATSTHARQSSTGRIPASPKVLDLHAHVGPSPPKSIEPLPPAMTSPALAVPTQPINHKHSVIIQEGSRPKPILTPTRTQPVKHVPSDSFDGSTPPSALAIPGYIPGQMRPVGSVRSDSSSRSGTPVGPTGSIVSVENTPTPTSRHMGASPLLARSQSVLTGSASARNTPTPAHQRNASLGHPVTESWRSASPLAQMSRTSAADIEEEDDGIIGGDRYEHDHSPDDPSPRVPSDEEDILIQQVAGKYSVARARSDAKPRKEQTKASGMQASTPMSEVGETSATHSLLDVPTADGKVRVTSHQSHQAHIEGESEYSYAPSSQARGPSAMSDRGDVAGQEAVPDPSNPQMPTPSRRWSTGSSFKGVFDGEDDLMDDYLHTPEVDVREVEAILGVSKATLDEIQQRLVAKAKAEREAFRAEMGDSPAMIMSPSMSASDLPAVPIHMRTMSPLATSGSRIATPVQRKSDASSVPTHSHITSPPPMPRDSGSLAERRSDSAQGIAGTSASAPTGTPPVVTNRSASIATAASAKSQSPGMPSSRKVSQGGKIAPEDDPDVVRDFEARIAAATAALQRQPSVSGPGAKLERKGTKRGAMKISSPTLVSSSSSISGTVLSPRGSTAGVIGADAALAPLPPSSFKSKPSHKMSLKWKNAFKRGASISDKDKDKDKDRGIVNPAIFSPPVIDPAPSSRNVSGASTATINTASTQISSKPQIPSREHADIQTIERAKTPQPGFGDFKFPSSAAAPAETNPAMVQIPAQDPSSRQPSLTASGSIRSVIGRIKRGKSDEAVSATERAASPAPLPRVPSGAVAADHRPSPHAAVSAPAVQQLKEAEGASAKSHKSTPSDDSAVAKFIAAGRALGLNDEQMNDMLAAKGMLYRSGSSRSNGSAALTAGSTISHASPSPVTPATGMVISPMVHSQDDTSGLIAPYIDSIKAPNAAEDGMPITKKEGLAGLVRALSKKRAPKASDTDAEHKERQKVIRRTILMPESSSHLAALLGARDSFASPQRSPRSQISFSAQQQQVPDSPSAPSFQRNRQNSIRRKPIALTAEEEQMLSESGSPVAPGRRMSGTSGNMGSPPSGSGNPGLGFLAPDAGVYERRPSGASGTSGQSGQSGPSRHDSVLDMYGNESLVNSQQGIEITEYEDGRMVWNVVDGLRDDDDDDSGSDYTQSGDFSHFQPHSRETSYASGHSAADDPTQGTTLSKGYNLPLRHRDRGSNQARPQTNLYFTSPTDVADLIDQLSQDPDAAGKGRIDFSLPSPPPVPDLPVLPTHRTPPMQGRAGAKGQFEDAPSPGANRRSPPAPINVGRANQAPAGGWSPKRQAQLRQAFGRAPAAVNSGGMARIHQTITPPGSTIPVASPGGDSIASLESPAAGQGQTRNVEDRLQALMDRLVKSGAVRQA